MNADLQGLQQRLALVRFSVVMPYTNPTSKVIMKL